MKKGLRELGRDDLGEDILSVLRKFEEWFYPASVTDAGREFMIFLHWLERNGYVIVKNDWNQL